MIFCTPDVYHCASAAGQRLIVPPTVAVAVATSWSCPGRLTGSPQVPDKFPTSVGQDAASAAAVVLPTCRGGELRSHRGTLRRSRGLVLACALPVVATMALTTGVAQATPAQASSDVASLQLQVHEGTLLSSHGVRTMCASGCHADVVTTSPGSDTVLSTDTPVGLGATDLAKAYSLPRASVGHKGTIALISTGANTHLESDLATYRKQYGLPACTTASGCLTVTDFHGGPPVVPGTTTEFKAAEEEAAVETSLDVDMASAACPDCHIMVVQTPDIDATGELLPAEKAADYAVAYQTAVRLGANAVSLSDVEFLDASTADADYSKAVRHPGVPLFASSGDISSPGTTAAGSDAAAKAGTVVDTSYTWPAELPWAVAVGGTSLKPVDASRTQFTETAWHDLTGGCALTLPPRPVSPPRSPPTAVATGPPPTCPPSPTRRAAPLSTTPTRPPPGSRTTGSSAAAPAPPRRSSPPGTSAAAGTRPAPSAPARSTGPRPRSSTTSPPTADRRPSASGSAGARRSASPAPAGTAPPASAHRTASAGSERHVLIRAAHSGRCRGVCTDSGVDPGGPGSMRPVRP